MRRSDQNVPPEGRGKSSSFREEVRAVAKEIYSSQANRKLAKDLIIEAIKGVPLLGGTVSATEKFIQGIAGIEREQRLERLETFLLGLNRDYDETVEYREEDLLPVIRKLATDDEKSKTEYYTRLSVTLGRTPLSEMPDDKRYHFIRLVSTLTSYQIRFARELKIRQTEPVRGSASSEEAELALTSQDSGIAIQAVRALQNAGLLKERAAPDTWKGSPSTPLYETTSDFDTLMSLVFHPDDFAPEFVGLTRKEISDIIIVGTYGFIDNLYSTYLPDALRRAGINAKTVDNNNDHLMTDWAPLYLHTGQYTHGNDEYVEVHLTQEGTRPRLNETVKYYTCRFDKKTYVQPRSRSSDDVKKFCKEMDRVVSCVIAQLKEQK